MGTTLSELTERLYAHESVGRLRLTHDGGSQLFGVIDLFVLEGYDRFKFFI